MTKKNKKAIVKATNNGAVTIDFPEIIAVFFKDGEPVDLDWGFMCSNISLLVGESYTKELRSNEAYDDVRVHVVGRAYK